MILVLRALGVGQVLAAIDEVEALAPRGSTQESSSRTARSASSWEASGRTRATSPS